MNPKYRLLRLSVLLCLLLGGIVPIVLASPSVVLADTPPPVEDELPDGSDWPLATPMPVDTSTPAAPTATLTVGTAPCTYATIAAAIAAANPGDVLLLEGGVTFNANAVVGKNLTLQGGYDGCGSASSAQTTINGGGVSFVVEVTNNTVTLRNLMLTGGNAGNGGGVRALNASRVTLDNTDVFGNQANNGGGIFIVTTSALTLTNDSDIRNNTALSNGGGARVWGRLVALDTLSDIDDNTAPHGGGVSVVQGALRLAQADMSGNRATDATGRGGAIHLTEGAVATLTGNVWLYDGNQAYDGAGIYADDSEIFLDGSTFGGNTASHWGGGIYLANGSMLSASSVEVGSNNSPYGNEALIGAGIYAQDSRVEFDGHLYNNRATTQGGGLAATSSVITLTHALVGGPDSNQANDITGGMFGAGLYFSDTHALLSNTVVSSNTFSSGAGWGGGIVAWNGSVVTLTHSSRVERHYAPNVSMFGGGAGGILIYSSTVTLDNSQVLSNTADYFGAGIYMVETSTLNVVNSSRIVNNHALNGEGGGIAATGVPDINIANTTLYSNSAGTDGGAIHLNAGRLDFTGGWTLQQNEANRNGGAIAVMGDAVANFSAGDYSLVYFNRALDGHGGMLYLGNDSTAKLYATQGAQMYIYANHASANGGALYADSGGYFDIYGQVNFDRNRADNGGAIYVSGGSRVWLDDYVNVAPQLWDNWADSGSGGAIYAVNSPRVECDGATLGQTADGNHASVSGGAVYLDSSTFSAENCSFLDNQSQQHGGAIAAYNNATLDIVAAYLSPALALERDMEQRALDSATILATGCNPALRQCSVLSGNIADSNVDTSGDGGAIYTNNSLLRINHTYLYRNAAYRGGAIYQTGSDAKGTVANSLVYSNTVAQALGAGIRNSGGAFTVTHVTLANNVGGSGFSGVATVVSNTIAWGYGSYSGFATAPASASCNIDDGGKAGLNVDPLFIAPGGGENYRLAPGSPAIDACATGLPIDLDNKARPMGAQYDMGPYEAMLQIYLPLVLRNF